MYVYCKFYCSPAKKHGSDPPIFWELVTPLIMQGCMQEFERGAVEPWTDSRIFWGAKPSSSKEVESEDRIDGAKPKKTGKGSGVARAPQTPRSRGGGGGAKKLARGPPEVVAVTSWPGAQRRCLRGPENRRYATEEGSGEGARLAFPQTFFGTSNSKPFILAHSWDKLWNKWQHTWFETMFNSHIHEKNRY